MVFMGSLSAITQIRNVVMRLVGRPIDWGNSAYTDHSYSVHTDSLKRPSSSKLKTNDSQVRDPAHDPQRTRFVIAIILLVFELQFLYPFL